MPTLIELQTERARLASLAATTEFDEAKAATRTAANLRAAAHAVRALLLGTLEALPARFAETITGESDETRVHYLLSDAIHTALSGIGEFAAVASTALPEFGAQLKKGARPRDLLTVSQYADKNRWLRSGTNAPGQWRTSLTPYLRDIMDDLSEHSPVRTVAFMKSSGVGGTEVIFNWLAYIMGHLGNKDVLMVVPTLELRDRSFNPRLAKMIDESDALTPLVTRSSRATANRADILEYGARARIVKAGANSPDSLRMDHLPYAICDEVDAFPWDVGGEGDPMTLIENRQRTFSRAKTLLVSTPTLADESRIEQAYRRSDQRKYFVPCPHCGTFQALEIERIKYRTAPQQEGAPADEAKRVLDAWYVCHDCGAEVREHDKPAMLSAGRWIAEHPERSLTHGYHLNAFYAPIGLGLTWRKIMQKWVDVQTDTAELKAFVNTYLGAVWREQGEGAEPTSLLARVETYSLATLLAAGRVLRLTAGVDVQKDRLEYSIVAWGAGEEGWLIEHGICAGDTASPDVWQQLDDDLKTSGIALAGVDSGYNTSFVFAFCGPRRWTVPVKGIGGPGRPLIEDDRRRKMRLRVRRKKGMPIEPLGTDQGKALIYARLKLPSQGAGYLHFPAHPAFDDEYFAQIAAEHLVKRLRGGRVFAEWKQTRPRNEALDCLLYALAACRLAGDLPKTQPASFQSLLESLAPDHSPTKTSLQTAKKMPSPPRLPRQPQTLGW